MELISCAESPLLCVSSSQPKTKQIAIVFFRYLMHIIVATGPTDMLNNKAARSHTIRPAQNRLFIDQGDFQPR